MSVRPELLIRGLDEIPVPPSDLVAELERRVPGCGLLYTRATWAVTLKWREDDPRRRFIQSGEMQPHADFDVVGHLPPTCSLDEAPAIIERELKNWPADHFRQLREAISAWNNVGREAVIQDQVMGEVWNDIDKGPEKPSALAEQLAAAKAENERLRAAPQSKGKAK